MKKVYLFITVFIQLFLITAGICQQGYLDFILKEYGSNVTIDDIVYKDGSLYVRGNLLIDSIGQFGLFLAQLDTFGNTLNFNLTHEKGVSMITNTPTRLQITAEGEFLLPNYFFQTNTLAFSVLSNLSDSIITYSYPKSEFTIFPEVAFKINEDYYLFGFIQRLNYLIDDFMMKINKDGNEVWTKYIGVYGHNETLGAVTKNPDNTFTVSTSRYTKDYFEPENPYAWRRPLMYSIDTSGTILWEWAGEYNDSKTHGGGPFHHLPNGDWIIISNDIIEVPLEFSAEIWSAPTITRLDSNFNLVWKDTLIEFAYYQNKIVDLEYDEVHDELILVGNRYFEYEDVESEIWVIKMKPSGEILWEISDTLSYNKKEIHFTAGVAISPSGSIFLSGYYKSDIPEPFTRGWLMKVTPDGCVDTLCDLISSIEDHLVEDASVTLYPVPASDVLHIETTTHFYASEFEIFNLNGILLMKGEIKGGFSKVLLAFSAGIYFIRIKNKEGKMSLAKFNIVK